MANKNKLLANLFYLATKHAMARGGMSAVISLASACKKYMAKVCSEFKRV